MKEDQFKNRLEIAKKKQLKKKLYKDDQPISSVGIAFKMSTELVAHVVVGTIIGFILDKTFDSKPWLILIFLFLGVISGIANVFRSAKSMQK